MTLDGPWTGGAALHVRRRYRATAAEVFAAFTEPARLRQWWFPRGFVVEDLDFTAAEGQPYRVALRAPDGVRYVHVGVVLEVQAPSLLRYTWRWVEGPLSPVETLVEVRISAGTDDVVVDIHHGRFANQAECDRHTGWFDAVDRLRDYLAGGPGRP
ncbi:MAG: SRPBCC domain-containing protein [Vicinamibacterales bacterium]